jgi:hypothetical protein
MRSMSVFLTDLGLVAALASDSRVLLHIAKKKGRQQGRQLGL